MVEHVEGTARQQRLLRQADAPQKRSQYAGLPDVVRRRNHEQKLVEHHLSRPPQ